MRSRLLQRLRHGFDVPFLGARLRVDLRRHPVAKGPEHRVRLGELRYLQARFPELRRFDAECVKSDPEACAALLEFCQALLPLIHEPAREVRRRSLLAELAQRVAPLADVASEEIARSNWASGVVDRGSPLLEAEAPESVKEVLRNAIRDHEAHYQAREGILAKRSLWRSMGGDVRGRCLAAYYRDHEDALRGQRILHLSPEPELRAFLLARRERLGLRYLTSNPFGRHEDLALDLTNLELPDESVDLVLCHRVLEHVLDDRSAIAEVFRVLTPGGVFSVSVPQSLHRAESEEWAMPDASCHGHVREYGRDFESRLAAAGFKVALERHLLDRSEAEHRRDRTYPMRFYHCTKPRAAEELRG